MARLPRSSSEAPIKKQPEMSYLRTRTDGSIVRKAGDERALT